MISTKQSLALLLLISSITLCVSKAPVMRPYQKETDQQALIAIIMQSPQYLLGEEWGATKEEQLAKAKKYLESDKYRTLVLEIDKEPVGFVNYCVYPIPKETIAMLHLLGVSKDHKRQGYGTLLANKALEAIKKEKPAYIMLSVMSKNKPAIALYEKLGFKPLYATPMVGNVPIMYKLEL